MPLSAKNLVKIGPVNCEMVAKGTVKKKTKTAEYIARSFSRPGGLNKNTSHHCYHLHRILQAQPFLILVFFIIFPLLLGAPN